VLHRSPENDAVRLLLLQLALLLPLGRRSPRRATGTPFQTLSAPGLILVVGVLPLVDHAQTICLLDEGPLVCVAQESVGARQCKVNTAGNTEKEDGRTKEGVD
jgi:hypothetical protein